MLSLFTLPDRSRWVMPDYPVRLACAMMWVLVQLVAHAAVAQAQSPRDVTHEFEVLFSPSGSLSVDAILKHSERDDFVPLNPPRNINRYPAEAWLRAVLPLGGSDFRYSVLEIPGQIFNYVDVWFLLPNGEVSHFRAGDRYPYIERAIKNADYAFPLPTQASGRVSVLIRARNETTHPMNFAARLWPEEEWTEHQFAIRMWYGVFLGGMLALAGYNLLIGASLRDSSYGYYVGYMLCIATAVFLLSGLAEEYLWPRGKPAPLVSAFNGIGAFFAVAFVNSFLGVRQRAARLFGFSTALSITAMLAGVWLSFHHALPGIPDALGAATVQLLSLACAVYFIVVSMYFYLNDTQQARFLSLGMGVLLASMVGYFLYTHAYLPYNLFSAHLLEVGALAEGMLLSLALADRIKILNKEKQAAERSALAMERAFSKRLIEVQERERQSISEALHDSIGHAVLILGNKLAQISDLDQKSGSSWRQAADKLQEPIELCGEIMGDIRRLSHDLHPHVLERLGLPAALESTFERALDDRVSWSLDIAEMPETSLSQEVELTAYRVIQEALSNVLKYSQATEVSCILKINGSKLECRLADNGVGFDPEKIAGDSQGLQESAGRIRLLGGEYMVNTDLGSGTVVTFSIPVAH